MVYNPFDKSISDELTLEDIQKLIDNKVAEGYYVEYKREFPQNEKIGRSIASFANSYGGWYIVGAKTDEHNVAIEICGFSLTDCPDPISKVREVIKSHIDPTPAFYSQVVSLLGDKAVLIVYVPSGQDKPFISKDARVYRRIADSSDPISEGNRYALDKLYEEGRESKRRFEEFCSDKRVFGKSQEHQGWVNIFFYPYPDIHYIDNFCSKDHLNKLLELSKTPLTLFPEIEKLSHLSRNIIFNSAQTTLNSVILRQIPITHLGLNGLEVELFSNGAAKILVPLQYLDSLSEWDFDKINSLQVKQALQVILFANPEESKISRLRFFDIGQLSVSVGCLLTYFIKTLCNELNLNDFKLAITVQNASTHVPFLDTDEWGKHVELFGLPVNNNSVIHIPPEKGEGLIINWDSQYSLWIGVCSFLSLSFGLPIEFSLQVIGQEFIKH